MNKRLLFITMATVIAMGLSGCTKTTTVSVTDENGNTTTTTTTTDEGVTTTVTENTDAEGNVTSHEEEVYTESDAEPIDQEQELDYEVVESDDGYKVTYNPEYFVYDNDGEYEGKDSVYIRCTIDEENTYENFIDVGIIKDYNAKELIEGIAFQNETEATPMHIVFANGEYDCYYCEKHVTDTFILSSYAIDGKNAPYLIEVGSHVYSDDDEYAYYVAGAMEEAFLSLEFEQ